MIPGKMVPGMGGAMDLVTGAKAVYVATTHLDKRGRPKLVRECTLPLTGKGVVSVVVTEFCLVRWQGGRMVLHEISPEVTLDELRENTTMDFDISPDLAPMKGIE
jgi:3-oxoacid CoA-transferase subunit B/acetate CoA/acetoacetate CoA-transferase beta subunit